MNRNVIDSSRIAAIGGLGLPAIRRVLSDFVGSLPDECQALRSLAARRRVSELHARLHRIRGAALTTGFVLVARIVSEWLEAADPLAPEWQEHFADAADQSASEWSKIAD